MSPAEPSPPDAGHPEDPTRREPEPGGVDPTKVTNSFSTVGPSSATPPEGRTAQDGPVRTENTPFGPGLAPLDSASALPQSLEPRYRLIRVLGKGGFANVYLAYDGVLDQQVAIKIMRLGMTSQTDRDRFLREARINAKLRHPSIATVFDIIQTPDGLQMVMEYYPFGTLADRIKAKGALHPREAIETARQIAEALAYAHKHDIIHRDIKPANIFLAGEGMVKLGDFGIAANTEIHDYTQTGMIIGTPLYMAPEQASDSRDVDPRTDIYPLGLTLYYMLTGLPPRVIDMENVPTLFRRLIKSATTPNRNQRLVSAEQFIAMLEQIRLHPGAPAKHASATAETLADEERPDPAISTAPEAATPPATDYPPAAQNTGEKALTTSPADPNESTTSSKALPLLGQTQSAMVQGRRRIPPNALVAILLLAGFMAVTVFLIAHGMRRKSPPNRPRQTRIALAPDSANAPAGGGSTQPAAAKPNAPTPASTAVTALNPKQASTPLPTPARPPAQEARASTPLPQPSPVTQPALAHGAVPLPPRPPAPAPQPRTIFEAAEQLGRSSRAVGQAMGLMRDSNKVDTSQPDRIVLLSTAIDTLEEEVQRTPSDPILHLVTALAYDRKGNSARARKHYDQAIALDKTSSQPFYINDAKIEVFRARHGLKPGLFNNPPSGPRGNLRAGRRFPPYRPGSDQ